MCPQKYTNRFIIVGVSLFLPFDLFIYVITEENTTLFLTSLFSQVVVHLRPSEPTLVLGSNYHLFLLLICMIVKTYVVIKKLHSSEKIHTQASLMFSFDVFLFFVLIVSIKFFFFNKRLLLERNTKWKILEVESFKVKKILQFWTPSKFKNIS